MTKQKVTLASFIANQREKMGSISQVALAEKCGIPAGTIASIESGYAKSPRPVTLKKIAEGLDVPTEVIFMLASNPEQEMYVDYDALNTFRIPYLGIIPTKTNFTHPNDSNELIPFPIDFIDEGDFILKVSGDSLSDEDIYDEDYIVISKQDSLKRSGDLMLCTIDGTTTLCRIYKKDDKYKVNGEYYAKSEITFVGKACISLNKRKL